MNITKRVGKQKELKEHTINLRINPVKCLVLEANRDG